MYRKIKRDDPPTRIQHYFEAVVPEYTDRDFQSHFRLTRNSFNLLLRILRPMMQGDEVRTGRPIKLIEKQLLAVLWILATPDSYR